MSQRKGEGDPAPPIVTVVMAARDASSTVVDSIASVQRQTLAEWELLVVDDGSTDDTQRVVQDLGRQDPRIKLLSTPRLGPSGARDAALARARGRYIAILDADDLAVPERLSKQVAVLDSDPSLAAVASAAFHFVRDGLPVGVRSAHPTSKSELRDSMREGGVIVWSNSTMCWRRETLNELNGFDPSFPTGEDAELMNRALYRHGMTILGLPEKLVWYRLSRNSLSTAGLRLQRMITRYLEVRNRCWLRNITPPSLSEFLMRRPTIREKTRWARHDFAAHLYREAGYRMASGTHTGIASRILLSTILHPRYVIRKLWNQRLRADRETL